MILYIGFALVVVITIVFYYLYMYCLELNRKLKTEVDYYSKNYYDLHAKYIKLYKDIHKVIEDN